MYLKVPIMYIVFTYLTVISIQKEKRFSIVPAADIITEMNKYIDKVNEIFKV